MASKSLIAEASTSGAIKDLDKITCAMCGKQVSKDSSKLRLHTGKHILKSTRKITETPALIAPVGVFSFSNSSGCSLSLHRLVCSHVGCAGCPQSTEIAQLLCISAKVLNTPLRSAPTFPLSATHPQSVVLTQLHAATFRLSVLFARRPKEQVLFPQSGDTICPNIFTVYIPDTKTKLKFQPYYVN
jgi:hypothetical protein